MMYGRETGNMHICSTHHIHGLVINTGLDVVLTLQEAREQLHLEALGETVRGYAFEAGAFPLVLAHSLAFALVLADTLVGLIAMQLFLVLLCFQGQRFCLRG